MRDGKWDYLKVELQSPNIPTVGANGTVVRRGTFTKSDLVGDYLFDIDVIAHLASKKPVKFAKVKTGIIHLYCGSDVGKFIRKQKRRVKDYLYYQKTGVRRYPWQKQNKLGLLRFILSCITIVPLIYQTLKGFLKKPDSTWFFHPVACWITLGVYGWGRISGLFGVQELSRKSWGQ